jgi:hypothetical protein
MWRQEFVVDASIFNCYGIDIFKPTIHRVAPFAETSLFPRPIVSRLYHGQSPTKRSALRIRYALDDATGYLLIAPITSFAALSPESFAPWAVEKKFGEVASPAKNRRPSTGAASTARIPACPGSACE